MFKRLQFFLQLIALFIATPTWACEGMADWAGFARNYDTMISGTLENQEIAAAEFVTSLKPRLVDSADPKLLGSLEHATALANGIRQKNLPNQAQVELHKGQIRWLKSQLRESGCDPEQLLGGSAESDSDLIRNVLVITLSLAAALAFIYYLRPRAFSLERWSRKRSIRHEIQVTLKVKVETEDGKIKTTRARGMNLTNGGVHLFWPSGAPKVDTRLTIMLPDMEKPGSLVWSNTFNSGVEFDDPLSNEQVETLAAALREEVIP